MGMNVDLLDDIFYYGSNEFAAKNKVNEMIIKNIHEDIIKRGIWPKFGSPETKCNKCMFFGVTCGPVAGRVGCLGGWKMTEE